jgi:trimethylguanosine synthase
MDRCSACIAVELDCNRANIIKNNAEVYGVSEKIQILNQDFLSYKRKKKADIVFMSPPWGGVDYASDTYSIYQ